jgi:general secretion pathway protein K
MRIAPRRARGVALVAVLLLVAGLVAIATAVVALTVSQRRAAQRSHEAEARRERLDGALRVALAEIAFGKAEGPYWHPRVPRIVEVGGQRVEVSLERESGRIDLNMADEKYLVAGLVAAGRTEGEARTGAVRIRDWIDADDEPTGREGAERDDYRRAGRSYEPRNGSMETLEEVRQVLGLEGLSDAALDVFTVYSQQREPAMSEASAELRVALGGVGSIPAIAIQLPNPADPVSYAGSVIRLQACEGGKTEGCRIAVVRVTGSSRQPWQILRWQ